MMLEFLFEFGHYWYFVITGVTFFIAAVISGLALIGAVGFGIFLLTGKLRTN